jgi:tRNA(Ile)-lysidine synthase
MHSDIRKRVLDTIQATIQEHEMFKNLQEIVVAFSSGPDSVCLLDTLTKLYKDNINFTIVYVNHGIRPSETLKKEEELTKKYAATYGVRYRIINLKMPKTKLGIEGTARKLRYRVLFNYMRRMHAQAIVLGHNLDDVVETFFMNLIRGSGARGLRSIPAKRLPYVRPLIALKKNEIIEYLKNEKLFCSKDETNELLDYRRNLLRHKIIPQILEINPDLHHAVRRAITILKQDDDCLEEQADKAYQRVAERKSNQVSLDIKKLLKYNSAIQSRIVMKTIRVLRGVLDGIESKHIAQILGLKDKETGKKISLPKKLYAQKEYNKVVVGILKSPRRLDITVNTDNDFLIIGDHVIKLKTVTKFDLKARKQNCEVFDLADIEMPLLIRSKKDGDFVETKVGRKKVKKIFQERKLPMHRRKDTMILCDQKGILWVIGIVRSSRALIKKDTQKIMVVDFARSN